MHNFAIVLTIYQFGNSPISSPQCACSAETKNGRAYCYARYSKITDICIGWHELTGFTYKHVVIKKTVNKEATVIR